MFAPMLILAWGLAMREPAAPATSIGPAHCSDCVEACAADSIHAAAVRAARSAARHGEWNEAAERWRDALLMDGRDGAHWLAFGDVLSHTERHREAAAAYERAIQADARLRERGARGVAGAYARMGNDRQAVRWLEQAIQLGARPAELLEDERFRRYRGEARLRGVLPRQVDRRGPDVARVERASM